MIKNKGGDILDKFINKDFNFGRNLENLKEENDAY